MHWRIVLKIGESMSSEELTRTLTKLHADLVNHPELDEDALRALKTVLGDIQFALDRTVENDVPDDSVPSGETASEDSPPVTGRLQSLIEDFESKHPQLTLTLSQIADRLSEMGI